MPDPAKYGKVEDWGKLSNKGKFSSAKRMTYVDQILKQPKQVGPGSYLT